MNITKTNFDIDEMLNDMPSITRPPRKCGITKHSKLHHRLAALAESVKDIRRDIRCIRKYTRTIDDDTSELLLYIHDNMSDICDDDVEFIKSNRLDIFASKAHVFILMEDFIRFILEDGDRIAFIGKEDGDQMYSHDDFINDVINKIDSTSHPLYAYYKPKDNHGTKVIVRSTIARYPDINLNWVDVSHQDDLNRIFVRSKFHGDISLWNPAKAKNLSYMFCGCDFNGDISKWRFPMADDLQKMFADSIFNGDISQWEFPNVTNVIAMFSCSAFNRDVPDWKFPKCLHFEAMFQSSDFHGDISNWETPVAENMTSMFRALDTPLDMDFSKWKLPKLETCIGMFGMCEIRSDLSMLKFPNLEDATAMFAHSKVYK